MARVAAIGGADEGAKVAEWSVSARRGRMLAEGGHAVADTPDRIDPTHLSVEQAAKLLSAAGRQRVPQEQIASDIEAGAPTNTDGTLNLVHYAAWLVKEMGRGS